MVSHEKEKALPWRRTKGIENETGNSKNSTKTERKAINMRFSTVVSLGSYCSVQSTGLYAEVLL